MIYLKEAEEEGMTYLQLVVVSGKGRAVRTLLKNGADLHVHTQRAADGGAEHGGMQAIHLCASGGHAEIMRPLLEGGADVQARAAAGGTGGRCRVRTVSAADFCRGGRESSG